MEEPVIVFIIIMGYEKESLQEEAEPVARYDRVEVILIILIIIVNIPITIILIKTMCICAIASRCGRVYLCAWLHGYKYVCHRFNYVRNNKGWMEGGALPDLENLGVEDADGASRTWTDVANMMMVMVRVIMIAMIIIFMTMIKV